MLDRASRRREPHTTCTPRKPVGIPLPHRSSLPGNPCLPPALYALFPSQSSASYHENTSDIGDSLFHDRQFRIEAIPSRSRMDNFLLRPVELACVKEVHDFGRGDIRAFFFADDAQ